MASKNTKLILWGGIICGVLAVGGGLTYYALKKSKKNGGGLYNQFANLMGVTQTASSSEADISACEAKCTADPSCKAASWNPATKECETSSGDPYSSWKDSAGWFLLVKRDEGTPASSWGDWGTCPVPCGGGASTVQTRTCTGKCPGASSKPCGQGTCDGLELEPEKTLPYPQPPYTQVDGLTDISQCEASCLGNSACTGIFWYDDDGVKRCFNYSGKYDLMQNSNPITIGGTLKSRVPKGAGSWNAFPACSCGVDQVTRTCADASCFGPSKLKCPAVSCAYDQFQDVSM